MFAHPTMTEGLKILFMSNSNTRERPRVEPKADKGTVSAADTLRLCWPEYPMEAGEAGLYLFSACTLATLLWHVEMR
jgi:hypothetical protein